MKKAEQNPYLPLRIRRWLSRWTTLEDIERSLVDEPSSGIEAWARTTAGVVAMLVVVQAVTGVLLAFYYVPSAESAHTTVAYIEKVLPAGSWLRAMHHYGSQWLTLFLVLHLAQMFWRKGYSRRPVGWMSTVILLALVLAGGATGYSLPWDARAFFGTRVTEGIAGGIPLMGDASRRWLLGGTEITPITLARFFALHVLVVPVLILIVIMARLFVFRERGIVSDEEERRLEGWMFGQVARNALAAGMVFVALALWASRFYAPLGPAADTAAPGYLPRPGAQFLWLFQLLKYLPGRLASTVAVALPSLIFIGLASLPFLNPPQLRKVMKHPRRNLGVALFVLGFALFTTMTVIAYVEDARDPRVRAQLARQSKEEEAFRTTAFTPLRTRTSESNIEDEPGETGAGPGVEKGANTGTGSPDANSSPSPGVTVSPKPTTSSTAPPDAYITSCSGCHGTRGQGASIYPRLIGVTDKPQRTIEDLIAIINDPASFGMDPLMPSFANKLSEDEKRAIAEWIATLKKRK
ncbi:MAG TPA: cytochrome b N-terminal domain-containing protein [Pyrinomonadaceae bacterium]|jgi:ubiquinol-cytochrome c reductase cytochrome b subunit|nr:cytochrome b N-terminal domain-containing protein [Pyrinomonadaceae bacterium]